MISMDDVMDHVKEADHDMEKASREPVHDLGSKFHVLASGEEISQSVANRKFSIFKDTSKTTEIVATLVEDGIATATDQRCVFRSNGRRSSTSQKNIMCRFCRKKYYDAVVLQRHMTRAHLRRVYFCHRCHKVFVTTQTLTSHEKLCFGPGTDARTPSSDPIDPCACCQEPLDDIESARLHSLLCGRYIICGHCGKAISSPSVIQDHSLICAPRRHRKCPLCGLCYIHVSHISGCSRRQWAAGHKQTLTGRGRDELAPKSRLKTKAKTKFKFKFIAKSVANSETKSDVESEAKFDANSEPKSDVKSDAMFDANSEPKSDFKPDANSEPKFDVKPDANSEPKSDAKSEAKSETNSFVKSLVAPGLQVLSQVDALQGDTFDGGKGCRWSSAWEALSVVAWFSQVPVRHRIGDAFVKVNQHCTAYCRWCCIRLSYASLGLKALLRHFNSKRHLREFRKHFARRLQVTGYMNKFELNVLPKDIENDTCRKCGRSFRSQHLLTLHEPKCTTVVLVDCARCGRPFLPSVLTIHEFTCETVPSPPLFSSPSTSSTPAAEASLVALLNASAFPCLLCCLPLASSEALAQHFVAEHKSGLSPCPLCGRCLSHCRLQPHILLHLRWAALHARCDLCGLPQLHMFRDHLGSGAAYLGRSHTCVFVAEEGCLRCLACPNKTFPFGMPAALLHAHLHAAAAPLPCRNCGLPFACSQDRSLHRVGAHAELSWGYRQRCHHCGVLPGGGVRRRRHSRLCPYRGRPKNPIRPTKSISQYFEEWPSSSAHEEMETIESTRCDEEEGPPGQGPCDAEMGPLGSYPFDAERGPPVAVPDGKEMEPFVSAASDGERWQHDSSPRDGKGPVDCAHCNEERGPCDTDPCDEQMGRRDSAPCDEERGPSVSALGDAEMGPTCSAPSAEKSRQPSPTPCGEKEMSLGPSPMNISTTTDDPSQIIASRPLLTGERACELEASDANCPPLPAESYDPQPVCLEGVVVSRHTETASEPMEIDAVSE